MPNYLKVSLLAFLAGYLMARGGAGNQNWILVLIGLFIWLRVVITYQLTKALYATFLIWFITAFFTLDWLNVLGFDAKLALCLFIGIYWSGSIWMWRQLIKPRESLSSTILGFHVVASEYILSVAPFGGFNWLRISYLLSDIPIADISYWVGVGWISFLVIAGLHYLVVSKSRLTSISFLIILLLFTYVISLTTLPGGQNISESSLKILGVQGGVPEVGLDFNAQRAAVFANHLNYTKIQLDRLKGRNESVDLVLWPENSSDIDPFENTNLKNLLQKASVDFNTPILFGAVLQGQSGLRNAAVLADSNQLEVKYVKQKLVPFGEYLPFRNILAPLITRFDRLAKDFQPGSEFRSVLINESRIGVLICYEIAFDQLWSHARKNSDLIVVMTNNATYGGTMQPLQQLRITQLQARSLKIPVMIVSTSGVSAYINKNGEIENIVEKNVATSLIRTIPHMEKRSPSTYIGVPFQIFSLGFIILLVLFRLLKISSVRRRELNRYRQ